MTTAKKATAARGIEDILAAARPRETEITLCLAGDLAADAERLTAEIDRLGATYAPSSLADVDPRRELAAELDKVIAKMRQAEVTFRFRGLGRKEYSDLLAEHAPRPGTSDGQWNVETFPPALVVASCIDPEMTVEQGAALYEVVNDGQRGELFTAAWSANNRGTQVPTSRAVSASPSSSGAR